MRYLELGDLRSGREKIFFGENLIVSGFRRVLNLLIEILTSFGFLAVAQCDKIGNGWPKIYSFHL
jgi:hypothetical protein